jgi:dTDP-4-dehydrorhamnose 3,5-epimerase
MMQMFSFERTKFDGAYLIKPFVSDDERGSFIKDYSKEVFEANGLHHDLKEVFYTYSRKGVVRAIHFQVIKEQAKLVRCVHGHVYDVLVDLRKDSPTFKQWQGFDLSFENNHELYVPEHFGHGYLVLKDSIVSYKCSEKFYGQYDSGIKWDDHDIAVEWPIDKVGGIDKIILSEKDKNLQTFNEFNTQL